MLNKIAVHFVDGKVRKGTTEDFFPNKAVFHITDKDSGLRQEITIHDLKAIYFVKSFDGNPDHQERGDVERFGLGKKIRVHFMDDETLIGYTQGFTPARPSFIVFPSDPDSNNEKILVVTAATNKVHFI
ncbi:MAG: hypothetical protein HXX11_04455 [Desulfuromonadales bacterium]|nr:hypothetical protein [Desulfuromonadales bacterium]